MSVVSALFSAASALSSLGQGIQVISNNIANINTVGFKGARGTFEDLLSQTLTGGTAQIGRGVNLATVDNLFHQGSFQNTTTVTDLGINGEGFFVLQRGQEQFYTRAGQFSVDSQGYLVNPDDLRVQGYQYDITGNPMGQLGDINLSFTTTQPRMTGDGGTVPDTPDGSGIILSANFDADAEVLTYDPDNAGGTSNFSSTITIYDSLGNGHQLTIFFNKLDPVTGPPIVNQYQFHISCPDALNQSELDLIEETVEFDENGNLDLSTSALFQVEFDFDGAQQDQVVGINFSGSTYYAAESAVKYQTQDGFSAGNLTSLNIDEEGNIIGVFSNGTSRTLAQLAIARFENNNGLLRAGSNLFTKTGISGEALIVTPTVSGTGTIISSALELSNVDLAQEFINLITTQRGYQASSRVIVTSDEIMEQLVNLT